MAESIVVKIIAILVVAIIAFSNAIKSNQAELDSVINMLLNEDDIETENPNADVEGEQPMFSDGMWKCGSCDVIDANKLIYSEVNEVDTNDISDDRLIVVQVGLNLDNMRCVTVVAGGGTAVRKEIGACAGDAVTLGVYNATHFVVNVYSD